MNRLNFLPSPPRAILPKKKKKKKKNFPKNLPKNLPEKLPKKAEIFPKIQPRLTQHSLISLQYKLCLSLLHNNNNKPTHATLFICYNLMLHLKINAKSIIYFLKTALESLISMFLSMHPCHSKTYLLINFSLTYIDISHYAFFLSCSRMETFTPITDEEANIQNRGRRYTRTPLQLQVLSFSQEVPLQKQMAGTSRNNTFDPG